jgi:Arc/MetJ family transcription regulator
MGGVYYIWYHFSRWIVRTHIMLDDRLVRQTMKLAAARTLREAVDIALLPLHDDRDFEAIRGKGEWVIE